MKFSYVLPDPASYRSPDAFVADVACMKEIGYDAIELQIADPADTDESNLQRILDEVGFDLIAIQTGTTYYSHGNCLSSPDAAVRKRTIDLLNRFVEFAARFSSILVFGSLQGRTTDEPEYPVGMGRIVEAVSKVGKYATVKGVVLAYEPVNHLETAYCNTIEQVEHVVRTLNLPGVQMMIDTFHMNIEEQSMTDCFRDIKDLIKHVHLSDTNRDILGRGHWDCQAFFETLREIDYDGYCSVGVYNTRSETTECMKRCMDSLSLFQ